MTIEKLRQLYEAQPFDPITLHLADGRAVRVVSREFMSFSPSGRLVHVFHSDDRSEFIDLLLVSRVEVGNGRVKKRRM